MAAAETDVVDVRAPQIPLDRFGVRLAIIRAEMGWNYNQAEAATGVSGQNWRLWERRDSTPRHFEEICSQIAKVTGYDITWIKAGGSLRSRCFSGLTLLEGGTGQLELDFDHAERVNLVAVPA